jgi:hypothetical protein
LRRKKSIYSYGENQLKLNRPRVPIGLPAAALICLVLGLIARPIIGSTATEEQLIRNVLLSAIPFILIFLAILLTFITLIWLVASMLNDNVPQRVYRVVEAVVIGGIVLGILMMIQPFLFELYSPGFLVLFISVLLFIAWSHIRPAGEVVRGDTTAVSVGEAVGPGEVGPD